MATEPWWGTLRTVWRRLALGRARRRATRNTVCVVGPGKQFLSGMTYHTYSLVTALARRGPTTAILLRNLVPRRLYPGQARVGADLSHLRLPASVARAERVDWWWVPGIVEAWWLLLRRPPAVLVVQWWSGAVWHTQLALILVARALGARVVLEIHETIDTAEARTAPARLWVRFMAPRLLNRADRVVVHSQADRAQVARVLRVPPGRIDVVVEPVFDTYHVDTSGALPGRNGTGSHDASGSAGAAGGGAQHRHGDDGHDAVIAEPGSRPGTHLGPIELLFFGTIRPYKGLEDLVAAFELLCGLDDEGDRWALTVVGETWEGWTEPLSRIARSRHRDRITVVNQYVPDEDVHRYFTAADVVVLPYHRSSTSGPLMVAMSYGKPVVVTSVGGLPEAADGYEGAVFVPPRDHVALAEGIAKAETLVGHVFEAPRGWDDVAAEHEDLYRRLGVRGRR